MDKQEVRKIAKVIAKFSRNYLKSLGYELKEESRRNFKISSIVYTEILIGNFLYQNELDK